MALLALLALLAERGWETLGIFLPAESPITHITHITANSPSSSPLVAYQMTLALGPTRCAE